MGFYLEFRKARLVDNSRKSSSDMEYSYVVLLKPSEIRFTTNYLKERFDNNIPLTETLTQLQKGEILVDDIPFIEVIWYQEKWEWYTLNNRRLWVFQQLEKSGDCQLIKTHRIERVENIFEYPALLYGSANLQTNLQIKEESPCRKVSFQAAAWNSQTAERNARKRRKERFEYREMRVSIEEKSYSEHHTSGGYQTHQTYHKTCTVSEYKSQHRLQRSRNSRGRHRQSHIHRNLSKRSSSSSLMKLVPSRKHISSAGDLQEYADRTSRGTYGPICGIVTREFWQKKRYQFLQRVYSLQTGRLKDPGIITNVMFTCGVCYKSFKTRVRLEQHCEELMHYACVRCGRFFTSNTALGQHRIALTHYVY